MSELIIIRGNSGSGKSTIARELREKITKHTALVEQDYLRRHVLGEIGKGGDDNIELINRVTRFSLDHGYVTILEGIMPTKYYGDMLRDLADYALKAHVIYLDVSLEETLKRHESKPNKDEFGEAEMRDWYAERDVLGTEDEIILKNEFMGDSLERILSEIE